MNRPAIMSTDEAAVSEHVPAAPGPLTDFRDIAVAGRRVRIMADPTSTTIPVYEVPDPCVLLYLGRVTSADGALPKLLLAKDNTAWAAEQRVRDTIRAAALGYWRQVRVNHLRATGTLGLPVLARPTIAGRVLCLGLVYRQPRIRVTFAEVTPHYVGTVVELDGGHPRFIAGPAHLDWVRTGDRTRRLVDAARIAYARRTAGA